VYEVEATWVREIVRKAEQKRIVPKKLIQEPDIIQRLLDASCEAYVPRYSGYIAEYEATAHMAEDRVEEVMDTW
jgi:glutamine synthetase adenylyltransferase